MLAVTVLALPSPRSQYVLVLVQELQTHPDGSAVSPTRSLATYSLSELKALTALYSRNQDGRVSGQPQFYVDERM